MKKNNNTLNWELLYAALTSDPNPAMHEQWKQACREQEQYIILYTELKPLFEQADEPELADLYKHLDRINRLHQATQQPGRLIRWPVINKHWWWIAALVTGISITAWWTIATHHTEKTVPVSWKLVQAPEGKITLLHFPDGSVVSLSPASVIRFPDQFNSRQREVYLTGEAYFTIAKDSTRPFFVHSGPITTKVTGTAFAMKGDSITGEYEVRLVEGSVSLLHKGQQEGQLLGNLLPKQAFIYNQSNAHWHIEPMSAGETAAIAAGGFVFKNTPLRKIARQLELYYSVTAGFTDKAIQELEFTATFSKPSLSEILYVLEAGGKVTITRRQDRIIFSPKQ